MDNDSNSSGKKTGLIVGIVIAIIALVGAWYWFMYLPEQEAIEKARQEQRAKAAAAARKKKREEQAAKKKADYDQLIVEADQAFEGANWEAAQSAYSQASGLFPDEQYPQDQLLLVNEELDKIAARLRGGTIETISSATGRFYIVVSSSLDGDLASDYANKLAEEGNNVKLIEPYDDQRFYRLSLDDYGSWDEAVNASASFNSVDGGEVWVLKY